MQPSDIDKYLYVRETPTWYIRVVYIVAILCWALALWGFFGALQYDLFYRYAVGPIVLFFTVYQFTSFGLNLFYRQFDITKHKALIVAYWDAQPTQPSVDIFLPVCGEAADILAHVWDNVTRLAYTNYKVFVLDDSRTHTELHRSMALARGFGYFERSNKGEMKKAGNLKYAFERTTGDFIAIFDADFAPHPQFLTDLLPYMDTPTVAIVQTPQYFETSDRVHAISPIQYAAALSQEHFYRFIQVARDRFNAAICCGSNAIYRRAALDEIGGTAQVLHSEDARTGIALQSRGWRVQYLPIILAIGINPDNAHAYFHQHHRWCSGSMELMLSKEFWTSPLSPLVKLCYTTGFMFYLSSPINLLFSFQIFYSLFAYNPTINFSSGLPFYPNLIFSFVFIGMFPIMRFRWSVFYVTLLQAYAYSHAIFSTFVRSAVPWIPTNAKHIGASVAFRQATTAATVYLGLYGILTGLAAAFSMLHPFTLRYYSLQFWIIYNAVLTGILLYHMRKTIADMRATAAARHPAALSPVAARGLLPLQKQKR